MLAIYVNAGHTASGNPKRGWFIADDNGTFIDFVDEGYYGDPGALIHAGYENIERTVRMDVTGSTYRDGLRLGKERVLKTKTVRG